ncbi:MAG: DUF1488 family protein [Proteobacteria bacterium]|nr:DUF1488 family protein [Pseudomonadota bacterium]
MRRSIRISTISWQHRYQSLFSLLRKLVSPSAVRHDEGLATRNLVATADGAEVDGLAVRWTMSNGTRKIVCWVRAAALEKLEANSDLEKSMYLAAFLNHRHTLENAASAIYARGLLDGEAVVVRKENV